MRILDLNKTSKFPDVALLIARVGIAVLMLTHGIPKLLMLLSDTPAKFPSVMGMSSKVTLLFAVFAEVFCSVFILVGFLTRFATVPLIITMVFAALVIHAGDPLNVRESALQYLLSYIVLLFAGSGRYSVDYLLQKS